MDQIVLTLEGKKKLESELQELREVRRPEIIAKIEQAREMGDLSENAEYHDAKDQQGMIESRIFEIEETLKKAIINQASGKKDHIEIGTTFVVADQAQKQKEYTIVGFNEADPINGKISNNSPLGFAFMGKKEGDSVEVEAPKGIIIYKILQLK